MLMQFDTYVCSVLSTYFEGDYDMPQLSVADFDAQFVRLRPMLEAYARQRVSFEDAEDLVSGCFLQARHSLAIYRSERDLTAWLKGILENLLRLHFRRVRIRREDSYDSNATPIEREAKGEREAAQKFALRRRLYMRIAAIDLTARQYECLLRTLEGETQQQIATGLGITQRAVGYHLQLAQEHLRDFPKGKPDIDRFEFFYDCAHHPIYRKPHSFDNQSNSLDREQHRYACLKEHKREEKGRKRKEIVAANTRE